MGSWENSLNDAILHDWLTFFSKGSEIAYPIQLIFDAGVRFPHPLRTRQLRFATPYLGNGERLVSTEYVGTAH